MPVQWNNMGHSQAPTRRTQGALGHSADYPTRWTIPRCEHRCLRNVGAEAPSHGPSALKTLVGQTCAKILYLTHMQVNWNWDAERHVVRKALAQPFVQNSLIKTQLLLQQIKHNIKIIEEYHPIKAAWIITSCSSWLVRVAQTRQVIRTIFPLKTSKC